MKQTWKSLKTLICSRSEWTEDKDQSTCNCCHKPFIFFFRRKHHCRSCGRIFCSNCSEHYINGTYIDEKLQKYLRLCEFCNQKVESSLRQINICLQQQLPEQDYDEFSETSSSDSEDRDTILPIFEQLTTANSRNEKMLDDLIKSKLKTISALLCQKHALETTWEQKLADYAFKAADEAIIDSIFSKNTMDILKTVNIETVCCFKYQSTRIFKGYASENNIISKQMRSSFLKPKIIIIMGSLEISSFAEEKLKFQDLITKQKPILKKILWKLVKLNPDLIFVEGVVNYTAKQYLQSKGIAVVCKLNAKVLENIKRITRIRKTIDKIHKVQTYKPEQVVGTCKRLYFQKHQNHEGVEKTLMYLEQSDCSIVSIVLAHDNEIQLQKLRKAMQQLLKIARQLTLEKEIVEIEQTKLIKPNKHFQISIVSFLDQQISIQKLLDIKQCRFSRAKYTPLKLSNFPDIQSLAQIQQYKKNSPYSFRNVLQKSWELCNNPTMLVKEFYSDDDISLGGFFLLEVANMNLNCQNCGKQKYTHTNLFHYSDRYVKVWLEKSKQDMERQHENDDNKQVNIYISKQLLHIHLKQKFKGQTISSKQRIKTYLECGKCHIRFSDEISLSKKYLENSFQYFLLRLFLSQQIEYDSIDLQAVCTHSQINRVIQSEDVSLKFQTGKLSLYSISEIDFTLQETKTYLLQQDLSHVNQFVMTEFPRVAEYVVSIISQLQDLTFSTTQGLTKRGQKYRDLEIKLTETCSSLLDHIKQTKQTYSSNLEVLVQDYTIIKKELDQVIIYLDMIYKVYLKIQHFHRKDKKEQDEPQSEDLNLEGSISKLNMSGMENHINVKLENLKDYLDEYKKLSWGSQDQMDTFQYCPVFKDNPVSIVAYALNSKEYQKIKDSNESATIKIQTTQKHYQIQSISNLINPILQQLKLDTRANKNDHSVKVMFPKQFEEIRTHYGLDFDLYLKSLIDCHDINPSGGKSDAEFMRCYNHLFIIKEIKDKQFLVFCEFFFQYYQHIKNRSYISKIFGMYEVDNDKCLIVMQNLSFNLDIKSIVCYDLKGSDFKRFSSHKDGKQFTGKDTNFRLDRNGQPLYLDAKTYDSFLEILEKDCQFLLEQQVIDYSLLLMIDIEKNTIRAGIIDFMRPYNLIERVENIYKKIVKGNNPTVVEPKLYEGRFFRAMKRYFLRSESYMH